MCTRLCATRIVAMGKRKGKNTKDNKEHKKVKADEESAVDTTNNDLLSGPSLAVYQNVRYIITYCICSHIK
jgi:hypothetical protein